MSRVVVDTNILSFYFRQDTRFERYASELDGKQLVIFVHDGECESGG
jgi:rRNA-processing protein FCF1